MGSEVPKADWPSAMQSIKSAIGIGSPAKTEVADETEPISGKTGEGTATEPYDAGNKEDNIDDGEFKDAHESVEPEKTAESAAVSPITAAASDKVIETSDISPIKSEANATDVTAPDGDIKPADTKAADEKVAATSSAPETSTAETEPSKEKAKDATVGASAGATAAAVAAASAGSSESKDTKPALKSRASSGIGSPGWFKNALQRRKSKGDNLKKEKESTSTSTATPVAVPVSTPLKENAKPAGASKAAETQKTVSETPTADVKSADAPLSSTKPAETSAAAAPVATTSKSVESAKPAEEKKTVAAVTPVETKKTETKSAKYDSKPAKSHERKTSDASKFFKSVNPFKKRESKAGIAEEKEKKPETKSSDKKAVETGAVAGAATGATVAAAEAKKDDTKPNAVESSTTPADVKATNDITDTPSKEAAAPTSTQPAAPTSTETAAPNHVPSDPPVGLAEPAPAVSSTTASTNPKDVESVAWQPASSSKAAVDDDIAPDQKVPTDSTSDPVKVEEPTKTTAEPAVAASSSKAVPDDNIAPETKIPTDETSEPAKNVPRIEEPAEASSSDKGKGKETHSSSGGKNENVSAIPTAGGIRLGQRASEDRDVRRKSFASGDIASSSASTRAPTVNGTSKPLEPIKDDVAEKSETKTTTPSTTKTTPAKEEKSDATPNRRASVFGRLKNKVKS